MRLLYGDDPGFLADLILPHEKLLSLRLVVESGQHSLNHKTKSAFLANLFHAIPTSQRASFGPAHLLKYVVKTAEQMVKIARTDDAAGIQRR